MPIRYDGTRIFHKNTIDYAAYDSYQKEQKQRSRQDVDAVQKRIRERSYEQWKQWCPRDFRDATINSIGKHDPDVKDALIRAVKSSMQKGNPTSVMLGSKSRRTPSGITMARGKTWAMYAYVSSLCKAGVINDPVKEVLILTEATLLDRNTDWRDGGQYMKEVFSEERKLVIVDNINGGAGAMKRQKYGDDAWGRFVEAGQGRGIGFVFSFSGDFDDMGLKDIKSRILPLIQGQPYENAVITVGVDGNSGR